MGIPEAVWAAVMANEGWGQYTNHPQDRGGPTRYGISKNANPDVDVEHLTEALARRLYEERYWRPSGADRIMGASVAMALLMFDTVVQHGDGVRIIQAAVGTRADGVIGPATLAAVESTLHRRGEEQAIEDLLWERVTHYVQDVSWPSFGRGWMGRLRRLRPVLQGLLQAPQH